MPLELKYISGGTILIVEKEYDICLLLKTYFLRKGCQVSFVHTLDDAFETAASVLPDVIFIASCDNTRTIVANFLAIVPDIQLIACNQEIVYQK